ncbi:hypothetical protein ALT_2857 [Aspergillus lentulus]|uniref:Zn(2)-C6 fungal-type domain-containing protein n=1 Tax=Aspergillus lentulus TaxID=293939 RepID=A0AAN4PFV7_ASPLE|nr:uncharacterized protein IFM58399_04727 [Aspergillus lentulus]KAF4158587.1 hypothetical protein CNMCM6069_003973 [Aspergillus lentulus]KAF4161015.1 hypothetical protein CNMCM6936_003624 [Aspergillus lentulus]KAF4174198.1 hypothetical protein CNMCM8060_008939 [Aspergillus lentulus]KAF4193175.1 hypothetical protein CNMCM8694_009176 [Aspergillus lentulus]GAQ05536.1 hypothetical protein ALT_2857 [Aspergillus lentulus]
MTDISSASGSSSSSSNSVSSSSSRLIEPQFRLACEECHVRKVRCEPSLTGSGGSCEACRVNQRRCLFSLRSKIGRPRKQASSTNTKTAVHNTTGMSVSSGCPPSMTVLQMLAQSDDLRKELNGSQSPKDWSQSQSNGRRRVPVETNQWGNTAWHPISENLTMDPVGDISAVYNFEETGGFGIESERFGQLMTHNSVGAQMEPFSSDFAHAAESLQMDAFMTENWYVAGGVIESSETDGEQDFNNALKLYGELHNRCKATSLNILAESDQDELSSVFQILDKLNQITSVLQHNPSSQLQRTEQSKWRIVRVAVMEAVEMCIGVIEFNFRLHKNLGTADDGRCSAEESSPASSSSGNLAGCNGFTPKNEHRLGVQLKALELLLRLDHSLVRFRLFMSKLDCSHGSDHYHDSSSISGNMSRAPCKCWIISIPEIGTVRSQISELSDRLRGLWD